MTSSLLIVAGLVLALLLSIVIPPAVVQIVAVVLYLAVCLRHKPRRSS